MIGAGYRRIGAYQRSHDQRRKGWSRGGIRFPRKYSLDECPCKKDADYHIATSNATYIHSASPLPDIDSRTVSRVMAVT